MDSAMLFGCSGFVGTSIISYLLGMWPHLIFTEAYQVNTLLLNTLIGLVPALVVGLYGTRKFGLAGACGFIGGGMAMGIFLYLRLKQMNMARNTPGAPELEYPANWVWIMPLCWVIVCIMLALIFVSKDELPD